MKTLLLAMTIVLTATSAQASNFKFETTDNSQVSNLCVIAAKQGIKAADKAAQALGQLPQEFSLSAKCNNMSVKNFIKQFSN